MKKTLIFFIFLIKSSLFNDDKKIHYNSLPFKYYKQLNDINSSANVLFAKILALELGKQFSNSNSLNRDLILSGSKLRQQIQSFIKDFTKDF